MRKFDTSQGALSGRWRVSSKPQPAIPSTTCAATCKGIEHTARRAITRAQRPPSTTSTSTSADRSRTAHALPGSGFRWLVEAREGWDEVRLLERGPEQFDRRSATLDSRRYAKRYDCRAEAIYVAGALDWRLLVGDQVSLRTYADDAETLTLEQGKSETSWSQASEASEAQVWRGSAGRGCYGSGATKAWTQRRVPPGSSPRCCY